MLHPHTELRFVSSEVGYGIFATQDIPKGTVTWVQDKLDRTFTKNQMDSFTEPDRTNVYKYTYRTAQGLYLFCWDLTRFMNHSSDANSMITPYNFEIAIKDIRKDEELTNDYGTLNIEEPLTCSYKSNKGRQIIKPDDLLQFGDEWDALIRDAFKSSHLVDQPLRPWLSDQLRGKLMNFATGIENPDSIKSLYFAG